jgi:hypothetical protein
MNTQSKPAANKPRIRTKKLDMVEVAPDVWASMRELAALGEQVKAGAFITRERAEASLKAANTTLESAQAELVAARQQANEAQQALVLHRAQQPKTLPDPQHIAPHTPQNPSGQHASRPQRDQHINSSDQMAAWVAELRRRP